MAEAEATSEDIAKARADIARGDREARARKIEEARERAIKEAEDAERRHQEYITAINRQTDEIAHQTEVANRNADIARQDADIARLARGRESAKDWSYSDELDKVRAELRRSGEENRRSGEETSRSFAAEMEAARQTSALRDIGMQLELQRIGRPYGR